MRTGWAFDEWVGGGFDIDGEVAMFIEFYSAAAARVDERNPVVAWVRGFDGGAIGTIDKSSIGIRGRGDRASRGLP